VGQERPGQWNDSRRHPWAAREVRRLVPRLRGRGCALRFCELAAAEAHAVTRRNEAKFGTSPVGQDLVVELHDQLCRAAFHQGPIDRSTTAHPPIRIPSAHQHSPETWPCGHPGPRWAGVEGCTTTGLIVALPRTRSCPPAGEVPKLRFVPCGPSDALSLQRSFTEADWRNPRPRKRGQTPHLARCPGWTPRSFHWQGVPDPRGSPKPAAFLQSQFTA